MCEKKLETSACFQAPKIAKEGENLHPFRKRKTGEKGRRLEIQWRYMLDNVFSLRHGTDHVIKVKSGLFFLQGGPGSRYN